MSFQSQWIGFCSLYRKECSRFLKVWSQTVFSPVINSALYMLIFGVSLASMLKAEEGLSYLQFLVPGLVSLSALNNSLQNSASSVMIGKFHNDLQDLRVIPLSAVAIAAAYILAAITRGLICATVVFGVGQVFSYLQVGAWINVQSPFLLLFFLVGGCCFFGSLGLWAGFRSNSIDQINAVTQFLVLPLIYLGGVFFSLEVLAPFWKALAEYNPLVYIINGIRFSILGQSDVSLSRSVIALLIFVSLGLMVAWNGVRYGKYFRF